jgi:NAD(P)-dependent dehydrogenase (short-subunit alcohol dehydrogenase family)
MMETDQGSFELPNAGCDLSGQVALVTGATSGLGRRFALVLAAAGSAVAVAGRRQDKQASVTQEIVELGGLAIPVPLDVTDASQVSHAVDMAETIGPVTILVNCAGMPDARRAHKMPLELVDAVIATNLRAPFLLSCEVARRLMAVGSPGRIVNISSVAAFHYGGEAAALYSTTKAALNRMTEVLAVEWASYHINVNGIAPGFFASEMMDGMIGRMGDPTRSFPRKRLGHAAQLDSTLLYLVSPSSEFVTGTVVRVDDGQVPR